MIDISSKMGNNNNNNKIKTIFIGTPDFGAFCLSALYNSSLFEILAVITQPDKKIGRAQKLAAPPIKVKALNYNIPVFQPNKINQISEKIKNLKPDIIVVAAYSQLIPRIILNAPKYGCINVHGSLLPKYRGSACVQAAILNGDKKAGITIMEMDKNLDTGAIIEQSSISILPNDTTGSLFKKLSILSAKIIIPSLNKYISGELKTRPQNNSQASYTKTLRKLDGHIGWGKPADYTERFVRAMSPWPGAFTRMDNKKIIKIIKTESMPIMANNYPAGKIFNRKNKLAIQCGENALIIKKLQIEGKKIITGDEFLHGYQNLIGKILK
ncbi:MAG: methionyl-tRNA formyltransferase [Patescibacteria group bacterium]|nr:methionyl-tRNA formyltransferase [Patescibacteria group bacterium]